jgi:hypothetical protein
VVPLLAGFDRTAIDMFEGSMLVITPSSCGRRFYEHYGVGGWHSSVKEVCETVVACARALAAERQAELDAKAAA